MLQEPFPPLSWAILQKMMSAANGWSRAWRHTGSWALEVLQNRLGDDWPEAVTRSSPTGGAPYLVWACGHVAAFANLVELATRLELLATAEGTAKVRRTLRTDPRPAQLVHSEIQLEVAALALRAGMAAELEPPSVSGRPADVAFSSIDTRIVVETRAILTSDRWHDENAWTDALFDEIHQIETKYGVQCEGEISEFLDEEQTKELLHEIDTAARLAALHMQAPRLRTPGVTIDVVPGRTTSSRGLKGPRLQGDSWIRIAPRIREKAEASVDSGATWLRLDARDGLWQFTDWSTRSLPDKLRAIESALGDLLGDLEGLVLSCGPLLRQGAFTDETEQLGSGLIALRRCLPFMRVRETLVVYARESGLLPAEVWQDLYAHEAGWLDWALAELDLPSSDAILGR